MKNILLFLISLIFFLKSSAQPNYFSVANQKGFSSVTYKIINPYPHRYFTVGAYGGTILKEKTSGYVPYAGTITTNDHDLDEWQEIVDDNVGQASSILHESSVLNQLEHTLENAFSQINDLAVTPGFAGITPQSLHGFNSQNGIAQIFVINLNSNFDVSSKINITGDASDLFFMRWDTDQNFSNGYNGQVKFKSGGAIVPMGGLNAASFVHVAGEISGSGGGSTPAAPYPQGPRLNDGTGQIGRAHV